MGTFSASFTGRATEPVTIQLREPEVKITMPNTQVKKQAPRSDLMRACFFSMTSVNPSIPPEISIKWIRAPISRKEMRTTVLPLLSKVMNKAIESFVDAAEDIAAAHDHGSTQDTQQQRNKHVFGDKSQHDSQQRGTTDQKPNSIIFLLLP